MWNRLQRIHLERQTQLHVEEKERKGFIKA
jgi:hypothetical protein